MDTRRKSLDPLLQDSRAHRQSRRMRGVAHARVVNVMFVSDDFSTPHARDVAHPSQRVTRPP
ncbi:hypothetical protein [Marichromatium gracile]|uniref:hypothetical protein n=1 Tax=Marichromatium gracile TaxID=1048 RepID=UPI0012900BB4|nr:hypothetical protein [Marichromatium gracile]